MFLLHFHTHKHAHLSSGQLLENVEPILIFMADFQYFHYYDFFGFFSSSSSVFSILTFPLSLEIVIFTKLFFTPQSRRTLELWPDSQLSMIEEKI